MHQSGKLYIKAHQWMEMHLMHKVSIKMHQWDKLCIKAHQWMEMHLCINIDKDVPVGINYA